MVGSKDLFDRLPLGRAMLGADAQIVLNACPSAALVLDAAGHVVFANAAALAVGGEDLASIGRSITDLVAPWPLSEPDGLQALLNTPEGTRSCCVRISPFPTANGSFRIAWIEPPEDGHAAEQTVRDAERRLRYMIEMLPQAVCFFDAEDRYVLWNERYAELYADISAHLRPGIAFEEILRLSLASGDLGRR